MIHASERAPSRVQGPGGAGQGHLDPLPLPLTGLRGLAPEGERGAEGGGELERRQRIHLLRTRRRAIHEPSRGPGNGLALPAPASVQPRLHQHADDPARARGRR